MGEKFKNYTAKEIVEYIKQKKVENDDEWLDIQNWIDIFLKSNPPEEEKRLFVPFGWAESVCIICDGIKRWRESICMNCRKRENRFSYSCQIHKKHKVSDEGIPTEIWAKEKAECPYFEEE